MAKETHPGLGSDLLAIVKRLYRFIAQRIQIALPPAQARMLAAIEAHREARLAAFKATQRGSEGTSDTLAGLTRNR